MANDASPIRVLYLSTAFPKPQSPHLGPWGLRQARALARHGAEVLVVSCTTWVPKFLARLGVKRATAECPLEHDWVGVRAVYPRWLYTQRGDDADIVYNHPEFFGAIGWATGRGTLLEIVRGFKPDVIHAHHMTPNGLIAARLKAETGCPFVLTEHNVKELEHYESRPRRRAVGLRVVPEASRWIALGKAVERSMVRAFPEARTLVLPNGTDEPAPEVMAAKRPAELEGRLVVSCVAGFYPIKRIPTLVRAFGIVARRHQNAMLRVCGDGEQRALVEQAIRDAGVVDKVVLLGKATFDVVEREVRCSDVFALTPVNDTFPTVHLEAAALGRPQVWTAGGAICDYLKDGTHGYQVDSMSEESIAQGLGKLLADAEARERMGLACRRLFEEELSWDVVAPRLVGVYREVVREAAESQRR